MGHTVFSTATMSSTLISAVCLLIAGLAVVSAEKCLNRADYCDKQQAANCYAEVTRNECCDKCDGLKKGPEGCEWGDKATWCENYTAEDCETTPGVKEQCCAKCADAGTGGGDGGDGDGNGDGGDGGDGNDGGDGDGADAGGETDEELKRL